MRISTKILGLALCLSLLLGWACNQPAGGDSAGTDAASTGKLPDPPAPNPQAVNFPYAADDTSRTKLYPIDSSAIKTTASGLKYIIVQEGFGNVAKAGQKVVAHYHGTLTDGKKFDSSYDRGQPFEFQVGVGNVIKGWDEAFTTFPYGTKAILLIPSNLGYGEQGSPPNIPGNSELVFYVELVNII